MLIVLTAGQADAIGVIARNPNRQMADVAVEYHAHTDRVTATFYSESDDQATFEIFEISDDGTVTLIASLMSSWYGDFGYAETVGLDLDEDLIPEFPDRDERVLCACGCGQPAPIARQTRRDRGHVKGEPTRYIHNHHPRLTTPAYMEEDRGFNSPCWIWQRAISAGGYGRTWVDGKARQAHRVFYERFVGPIPDGLVIDHLCRVRHCVNPAHLEAVTDAENTRRGERATKTHCLNGHPLSGSNLDIRSRDGQTRRVCRECVRLRKARQKSCPQPDAVPSPPPSDVELSAEGGGA